MAPAEVRALFTIWSLGYAAAIHRFRPAVPACLAHSCTTELTPVETLRTRVSLSDQVAMIIIALLSTLLGAHVARSHPQYRGQYLHCRADLLRDRPFDRPRRERQLQ